MSFRLALLALLSTLVAGMPTFYINLDMPPRKRWVEVAKYYRDEVLAMAKVLNPLVDKLLGDARADWLKVAKYDEDIEEEMRGFVETINNSKMEVSFDKMRVNMLLYELASPTMACSGVLWAMRNGTVVHGRNMDYHFKFKMPDGRVLNWPDVTFQAIFVREGQPIIKATAWPGGMGFHTAMRIGGWSFEQNTRSEDNEWHANLKAAQMGGLPYQMVVRKVMETTPDFLEAARKMATAPYMAPSYFVMSGANPGEAAVITARRVTQNAQSHRAPRADIHRLTAGDRGWYLVQTNDDLSASPLDERRPVANANLASANQDMVSPEHMMQFMQTPPLWNQETVFTTVMVPATGHFETSLSTKAMPIDPRVLGRSSLATRETVSSSLRGDVRKHLW